MKKFDKIVRIEKKVNKLEEGKTYIEVTEKLDGANASFRLSEDGESIRKFSRNRELAGGKDDLVGFCGWVDENIKSEELSPRYIYFGEWMTPHSIDYKHHFNKFILFSLFDLEEEKYLKYDEVKAEGDRLGLDVTKLHFKGTYEGLEQVQEYVNKPGLEGIEDTEGVIVFAPEELDQDGQIRLKFVTERFQEVRGVKKKNTRQSLDGLFNSFVTQARFDKLIMKKQDEGELPRELEKKDIGKVLGELGDDFIDDIFEEELETMKEFLRKRVTSKQGRMLATFIDEHNK